MENKKENIKKQTLLEEYNLTDISDLEGVRGINSYHCQNNQWRTIHNGYGVELEINNNSQSIQTKLSKFLNYKYKWNIEHDSSIGSYYGMEIITQPYTQEEWLSNKEFIKQFFDLLKDKQLFEDNTTGLHIHISKKLIGKNDTIRENNINKLLLILENFKSQFIKFSRRSRNNLYYCNYISGSGDRFYKDIYTIKRNKVYGHNTCINRDTKTYEIRIFKSTTSASEFIATLQLVFNLVEIINREDITDLTFNDIINLNQEYEELINYCKENKISGKAKLIDKTKTIELLTLRENSKILKENYNYNRYISKVRDLINNNLDIYYKSKEEYNKNSDLYEELRFIYTQTYKNSNSLYYTITEINSLLSNYTTLYITNIESGERTQKRVFNQTYKNKYKELYQKLQSQFKNKGGVI